MQSKRNLRQIVTENVAWFLGCLVLAFLIWVMATSQLNPIEQWRMSEAIPIRILVDDGLVITNQDELRQTARVLVRAQRSVRDVLVADDIIITADLRGQPPGEHTVPLVATVARPVSHVNISPSQITVELEELASKLVEVRAEFENSLPPGYEIVGDPRFDVNQVTVSGPASKVNQVAAVHVPIDLSNQRGPIDDFARPVPVDADGRPVSGVTVDTQIIGVSVDIQGEA